MQRPFDLIIVGGGPAGMAAAAEALDHGLRVALVDERRALGGSVSGALGSSATDERASWLMPPLAPDEAALARARELERLAAGAEVVLDALVWGIFPGWTVAARLAGRTERYDAEQVVLATGSFVTRPTFPGHELMGVVTPLGLQSAIARGELGAGDRVALLGTGPEAAAVARWMRGRGTEPIAVIAEHRQSAAAPLIVMRAPPVATGDGRLQRLQVPDDGGGTTTLDVHWLCLCEPSSVAAELAGMAGCDLRWDGYRAGFRPVHGSDMSTSAPGCFVAGVLAGALDLEGSVTSGRLAGLAAAVRAGHAPAGALADALGRHHVPAPPAPPEPLPLLARGLGRDDAAIACHCTGHTIGDVRAAIAAGARSLDDVKRQAEAGMGICQGRDCHRTVVRLLEREGVVDVSTLRAMRVRAPIRPITAREMYAGELEA